MLFNSYIFIFFFLPVTLLGFWFITKNGGRRTAIAWLVTASLFFYGYWDPRYLFLLLSSILVNYAIGITLGSLKNISKKVLLIFGIVFNLSLIFYFKYANFFVDSLNDAAGTTYHLQTIILPLAISFFTFQQIAYIVDAYKGKTQEYNFLHYCLFVTFFPQLIAGPIVHHKDMLPQFMRGSMNKVNAQNIAIGLTIFTIGLAKKVLVADNIAIYATPVFNASEQGITLTFFEAWFGSLAYTLQLYFDFSGYSDMAIGIARLFGILLPLNFNSPYKSKNIIEFWRNWHITLSTFLRDYLYIPLGGSRKGSIRRYTNLFITMLLGGLWHGAGWTFVLWGALHGFYLIVNHGWHYIRVKLGHDLNLPSKWYSNALAKLLTFIAVVVSWVFFRSETYNGAFNILSSMFGFTGISLPSGAELYVQEYTPWFINLGLSFDGLFLNQLVEWGNGIFIICLALLGVFCLPNTQEIMNSYNPAHDYKALNIEKVSKLNSYFQWRPSLLSVSIMFSTFVYAVFSLSKISEFLYFNF
jgi:alginate O-acetyltransferase complex protein AlgI